MTVPITYAFDGYCGWCYGFAPALHKFARDNADRVSIRVLSAGMRIGDRIKPFRSLRFTTTSNEKVTETLGARFGPATVRWSRRAASRWTPTARPSA